MCPSQGSRTTASLGPKGSPPKPWRIMAMARAQFLTSSRFSSPFKQTSEQVGNRLTLSRNGRVREHKVPWRFVRSLDRRKQFVERFGQRRVSKDGLPEGCVGLPGQKSYLYHGHDLATFNTQHRAAQDPICIGVHYSLHHAARLVHL